jgi:hypothetical protein
MTVDRQGTRRYQLIDADTHVNEPPDLWTDRVPAKFKDRAPRMQPDVGGSGTGGRRMGRIQ